MRSPSLFPSAAHWHHTKCDDLDERGKHNCTFALHQVCVLIPSANSSGSDGKGRACACAWAFATHVYFYSCFAEIEQPPEWKPRRPNSFQQVAFAQWTHHVSALHSQFECLGATLQPSPLPTCLSLLLSLLRLPVTCILCFKAVNLFIFFARDTAFNLWWKNWSRRQNVPILSLHKAELFFFLFFSV